MKAAVLDNGFNHILFSELTGKTIKRYHIREGACTAAMEENDLMEVNHGTVCAALFSEFAGDTQLIGISISEQGCLPVENLKIALIWCMEHGIKVISMSIGITQPAKIRMLLPLFRTLFHRGIIVVAAGSNDGRIAFPAALSTVIGVGFGGESGKEICLFRDPIDGIDIRTDLPHSRVCKKLREKYGFIPPPSGSIVTPYIAARVINFLQEQKQGFALAKQLKQEFGIFMKAEWVAVRNKLFCCPEELHMRMEETTIPVIGLIYEEERSNDLSGLSLALHHILCDNEYYGVLLSTKLERDIDNNIFHAAKESAASDFLTMMDLTSPEILLLHLSKAVSFDCLKGEHMDVLIRSKGGRTIYEDRESVKLVYDEIEPAQITARQIFHRILEKFEVSIH